MWPLLVCSVLSIAVAVERIIFWCREKSREDTKTVDSILALTAQGDYAGAVAAGADKPSAVTRVLLSGLAHREYGLTESMEVAANNEIERMKRGISVLDTIVTMAPLLGILGTVTGIIQSFDLLGASEMGDPKGVISGIAQALITTATGLTIALVSLVPFNYFTNRVTKAAKHFEQTATQLEVAHKRGLSNATDKRV